MCPGQWLTCRKHPVILFLLAWCLHGSAAPFWTTAYYPGWEQASLPASNIDYSALTHIIHFSVVPNPDGTLNTDDNSISTANSADIVTRAHAAGVKVLICVGGANSETDFQSACSAATLPTFINNLTNFMAARGYDGLDIDWEPFPSSDDQLYTNLVIGLRSALNQFAQPKYITVATEAYPPYGDSPTAEYLMYASLQGKLDQINIMTYDLSGPYEGWVTWFNSPLYDGNLHFPGTDELVPSVNAAVTNFLGNGVAANKLAIAIPFYGYVWTGGTAASANTLTQPRQSWVNAPNITAYGYTDITADYYQTNRYHWDTVAQAAYLSVTNSIATNDDFISYDDPRSCQVKVSFARNNHLGGIMIWELGQDHQAGKPDPLLEAVKQAVAAPGQISAQTSGNNFNLSFTGISLGIYYVQWTSNLAAGSWNTLTLTNVSGLGGPLQITDPGALTNNPARYYRVTTPP